MNNGKFIHKLIVLCWMRGEGKCQIKGSKVLMFDGQIKKVEDIKKGEYLMGDDNTPRRVLSLVNGIDEMFDVIPERGEPLTVNKDHILSLKTRCDEVVDISLRDYIKESEDFKRKHHLFNVPVIFPAQKIDINPYYLGLGLSDNSFKEIIFLNSIPQEYKINSREVQLQVLAGIIDSAGYLNKNSFQIQKKNKTLIDDIAFLARSLGFYANIFKLINEYTITISGDCSIIPVRLKKKAQKQKINKDILATMIKEVKSIGKHEYYGFNLDGNGRYLTGDFTVTHNSLFVCLIQNWKFFCFPKQNITLGANSKDQVQFVHFDILKDIILNSPRLVQIVGKKNIQTKEIKLKNKKGETVSTIKSISSFSGIVSNITGYTFSEMFDMKSPKFFTQLDGSTRNVPNSLGVIDSTVSTKDHILYRLYQVYIKREDPTLYFSYRCSPKASSKDFWNPEMTQVQLNSYKAKFPPAEFDMYFKNTWESAANRLFSQSMINCTNYIGCNGSIGNQAELMKIQDKIINLEEAIEKSPDWFVQEKTEQIQEYKRQCKSIEDVYSLSTDSRHPRMCSNDELDALSELYDTNFAILCGIDRADPLKKRLDTGARTIISFIAKGIAGSKNNPGLFLDGTTVPNYIYFLLHLAHAERSDMDTMKVLIEQGIDEYEGIDSLCTERWGMWDIGDWCESHNINFDPITASYDKQRENFSELYTLIYSGKFKTPNIVLHGYKKDDLLKEELEYFNSDPINKFYGSSEKKELFGAQDDSIFSIGWGIYGGRLLGIDDFRERNTILSLGEFYKNYDLEGTY